jgi:hypothetical protein
MGAWLVNMVVSRRVASLGGSSGFDGGQRTSLPTRFQARTCPSLLDRFLGPTGSHRWRHGGGSRRVKPDLAELALTPHSPDVTLRGRALERSRQKAGAASAHCSLGLCGLSGTGGRLTRRFHPHGDGEGGHPGPA